MISSKPTPVAAADLLLRPSTSPLLILLHVPTPQGRNPMFFQRYLRLFRKRIIENILVPYISAYLKIKIEIFFKIQKSIISSLPNRVVAALPDFLSLVRVGRRGPRQCPHRIHVAQEEALAVPVQQVCNPTNYYA